MFLYLKLTTISKIIYIYKISKPKGRMLKIGAPDSVLKLISNNEYKHNSTFNIFLFVRQ